MVVDQSGTHAMVSGLVRTSVNGVLVASMAMPGSPGLMTANATSFAYVETRRNPPPGVLWYGPTALTKAVGTGPAPYERPGYLWVDDLVSDGSSIYFTVIASGTIATLAPGP
jgi:hypothetical protein